MMKMKIEDFLALKKAGYSDDEISAYNSANETETAVTEPETVSEPAPEEPKKVENALDRLVSSLVDEVKTLRGQMEQYFINHDSMNVNTSSEDIAQKILASVINPPKK